MTPSAPIRIAASTIAALLLALRITVSFASDDCKVIDPDLVGSYEGRCEGGHAHGKGIAKGKDTYDGEFVRGLQHGTGTYVWQSGARYEGQSANGRRHGEGVMSYSNGNVYEGSWRDGARSGHGILRWKDGAQYVGHWEGDKRNGNGEMTYVDGGVYDGTWRDGMRSGQGSLRWKDGALYVGSWVNDERTGQATMTWPNGARYVGDWVGGEMAGEGTMEFADGYKFVGEFYRGKEHGRGARTSPSGITRDGEWADGRQTSVGTMTMADGTRFDSWRSGKLDCRYACDRPEYPRASRDLAEVGLVTVRLLIGEDGHVVDSKIEGSSDYPKLDEAALRAHQKCRFIPFSVDGRPVRQWINMETLWTLEDQGKVEFAYDLGTWGTAKDAPKIKLPMRARYAALSEAYKKRFRQLYEGLPDDVEPPYPEKGLEVLLQQITQWQVKMKEAGMLIMDVHVDADGVARRVDVLTRPSREMARAVGAVAMRTAFKPAVCAGKPCAMPFPLQLRFTRE